MYVSIIIVLAFGISFCDNQIMNMLKLETAEDGHQRLLQFTILYMTMNMLELEQQKMGFNKNFGILTF